MKKTISLTAKESAGNIVVFDFDIETKMLLSMRFNDTCSYNFRKAICEHMPQVEGWLKSQYYDNCTIKDITDIDISFKAFWDLYANKVGNKARVQKKWNQLDEEVKIMALHGISKYRKFTNLKGIQMCFPETYINARYWENEM